jgi:hypothetical protein
MMPKGKRLKSSERRIAANRRNALLSSGPRTAAGKARVSQNALRHGLAVSVLKDSVLAAEVEALAQSLSDQDDELMAQGRIIAESEFDLERIRRASVSLINSRLASVTSGDQRKDPPAGLRDLCGETWLAGRETDGRIQSETLGEVMVELSSELSKLAKYEYRARSRLIRAINELLKLQGRRCRGEP